MPNIDYPDVDIDRFIELGDFVYHNPVFEILAEYADLCNIAYHNNLLSPVINPIISDTSHPLQTDLPKSGLEAVKILKYTSNKLDRIYTASSLGESIKLVQTSEAKAYRNKVSEWMSAFSAQNYDKMDMIEADIMKAQKAMKYKGILENIGKICTTIGITGTILTPIAPPASIIATIATLVGAPTLFDPTKKYLWASFGVYHR